MTSAWGIDHGLVSKAALIPRGGLAAHQASRAKEAAITTDALKRGANAHSFFSGAQLGRMNGDVNSAFGKLKTSGATGVRENAHVSEHSAPRKLKRNVKSGLAIGGGVAGAGGGVLAGDAIVRADKKRSAKRSS